MSFTILYEYAVKCNELLITVFLNYDLLLCDYSNSINVDDLKAIDVMYQSFIDCLLQASEDVMHECKTQESQVMGWNNVCKEVHTEAREAFLNRAAHGKPRQGPIFESMTRSRASFKYALRRCKASDSRGRLITLP